MDIMNYYLLVQIILDLLYKFHLISILSLFLVVFSVNQKMPVVSETKECSQSVHLVFHVTIEAFVICNHLFYLCSRADAQAGVKKLDCKSLIQAYCMVGVRSSLYI